ATRSFAQAGSDSPHAGRTSVTLPPPSAKSSSGMLTVLVRLLVLLVAPFGPPTTVVMSDFQEPSQFLRLVGVHASRVLDRFAHQRTERGQITDAAITLVTVVIGAVTEHVGVSER